MAQSADPSTGSTMVTKMNDFPHAATHLQHSFWPGALAPGHSSNTIFFRVGILPIAVGTKQRMRNCARKIVHQGFNKTAFKKLGSPP